MALVPNRPGWGEITVMCSSPSIGTNPVSAVGAVPAKGFIERITAAPGGTTTGTITIAVAINGGATIDGGNLTIPAGSNARAGTVFESALGVGGATGAAIVTEGDTITFTPSGGGGVNIPGAFAAVIRRG
jgi:hypothetical protein